MANQVQTLEQKNDYKASSTKLMLSILFDVIGMISFAIPVIAETTDLLWAPVATMLMTKMYKNTTGKIASAIVFIEELLPGIDFIPTFTITWFVEYFMNKK